MFITKWGKWLSSHIDCEHTQYRQFYKRRNSYIQAQWQIQDFMLSSQTGTQSSLSPGSLAQLTPSFLSFSTKIFSNQEMHVHIFLLSCTVSSLNIEAMSHLPLPSLILPSESSTSTSLHLCCHSLVPTAIISLMIAMINYSWMASILGSLQGFVSHRSLRNHCKTRIWLSHLFAENTFRL